MSIFGQAIAAFRHCLRKGGADPTKVTIIICADDPRVRYDVEKALMLDWDRHALCGAPVPPDMRALKLMGVRVVLSDLSEEQPQYLIAGRTPK